MITLILVVLFLYFLFSSVIFRFALTHPRLTGKHALKDLYNYLKFRRWRECRTYGCMDVYTADERQPFGSGKTLNMVANAISIYNTYNDVDIFNFDKGVWAKQFVHIYSNIELNNVPYIPLSNSYQLVQIASQDSVNNDDPNVHIYLFLFDELGRIFNSRDWKTNLNSDMMGAILQPRKNHIIILGTVQDFSLFDATLRKICTNVYSCTKKWRFLALRHYYAKDLERANFNADLIQTRNVFVRFATDRLYNSYNTMEVVSDLQKQIEAGQRLSNEEILNLSENGVELNSLTRVGKRFKRNVRR